MDMRDIVESVLGSDEGKKVMEVNVPNVKEPSIVTVSSDSDGIRITFKPTARAMPYRVNQKGDYLIDQNGSSYGLVFTDEALHHFLKGVEENTAGYDTEYGAVAEAFVMGELAKMSKLGETPYYVWIESIRAYVLMNVSVSDYNFGNFAPNYASRISHHYRFAVGGKTHTHIEVSRMSTLSTIDTGEVIETDDLEWNSFIGNDKGKKFNIWDPNKVSVAELMKEIPLINQLHLHEASIELWQEFLPELYSKDPPKFGKSAKHLVDKAALGVSITKGGKRT